MALAHPYVLLWFCGPSFSKPAPKQTSGLNERSGSNFAHAGLLFLCAAAEIVYFKIKERTERSGKGRNSPERTTVSVEAKTTSVSIHSN